MCLLRVELHWLSLGLWRIQERSVDARRNELPLSTLALRESYRCEMWISRGARARAEVVLVARPGTDGPTRPDVVPEAAEIATRLARLKLVTAQDEKKRRLMKVGRQRPKKTTEMEEIEVIPVDDEFSTREVRVNHRVMKPRLSGEMIFRRILRPMEVVKGL
ncbi:uncharacterized protein A4U43_C01F26530 [Asparagus officinalis]|uniref:Uncharacterized protein n=1 Tax=Asparagus officinalis TaxID=4686 RepID=A0A5P1FWC4_ASPOF|nr:uncharacterized protein A4U43_C01F26530 [Asparagus officinalis]